VSIQITGLDLLRKRLESIVSRAENFAPVTEQIGRLLVAKARARIDRGGDGDWPPLKKGKSKPLVGSGALRRSITFTYGGRGVTVFSPLPYSAIHQFGGWAGRGNKSFIPARPFLKITDDDIATIEKLLVSHISGE
jgi:phage virion morphogenesis protein